MADRSQKSNNSDLPEAVSGPTLAALLGVTDRQVRAWATEGVIERVGRGSYRLEQAVQAVLRRAESAGASDIERQRVSYMAAKAEALAVETAKAKGELIPLTEAHAALTTIVGAIRSEVQGLGTRATRDLGLRRQIDREADAALNRAAKRVAAFGASMTSQPEETEHEDD